ncbi:butyrophilin subfamily 3 member A1-like isoform X2 [Zootoca vivipara]|uniref:butyrophilin subfamily 3 member A1-like isoform X2 n=1 Tax=Zootoca vivipara TaxID=8524 RepID=UPI00159222D9|nr:butyrophilin subfamily 3 member A1-like isoform X2 [Zootoca vivipara]
MEGVLKHIFLVGFTVISYVGEWKKAVYIKGTVSPEIAQVGQDVILGCQVGGCTSSRLQVHLYKWEGSKNQTFYIHNSTEQHHSVQEISIAENKKHKGYYENGFLEVTLLQVQLTNSGQYVCSMMCDDVYKEDIVEVTVEGLISVTVGDVAILPCQMIETYHPSHLKLQWRRSSPGKSRMIYSYQLHWDTCPSVCYGDKFVPRCPYSNRPKSQVWLTKKYKLKAEVLKRNNLGDGNISLKLNNIQEEDAGKYECSVNSNLHRKVVIYKLDVRGVSIVGNVNPKIGRIGQDVILHCQVRECKSSRLQVQLYKWEGSKNHTLYIHNSTNQHRVEERSTGESDENGIRKGYYGLLEVTLLNVQLVDSGQYVCAATCDDDYKEDIVEVTIEEVPVQSAEVWKFYTFPFLAFLFSTFLFSTFLFIVSWHISRKMEELKKGYEKLKGEMKAKTEQYEAEKEQLETAKDDVVLDPRTAHPKLKVSEDGKSVWNTGNVSKVSDWEERFDSRTFILANHGFSEGTHYWEVQIGQKKTWDLGVASATSSRKGEITLSPENGYWVIGCDDGKDYWARTEQWTRLKVNGKLTKLGIFLDKSAGSLSFYDVCSLSKLHTYKTLGDGELYPFFCIGSVIEQPLKIV